MATVAKGYDLDYAWRAVGRLPRRGVLSRGHGGGERQARGGGRELGGWVSR